MFAAPLSGGEIDAIQLLAQQYQIAGRRSEVSF